MAEFQEAKIKLPRNQGADSNILQVRILLIPKDGNPQAEPKTNAQLLAQALRFIDQDILVELSAAISEMLKTSSK